MKLNTQIKKERKKQKITQETLAGMAGISVRTIRNIEAGRNDSFYRMVERLADQLGKKITLSDKD